MAGSGPRCCSDDWNYCKLHIHIFKQAYNHNNITSLTEWSEGALCDYKNKGKYILNPFPRSLTLTGSIQTADKYGSQRDIDGFEKYFSGGFNLWMSSCCEMSVGELTFSK